MRDTKYKDTDWRRKKYEKTELTSEKKKQKEKREKYQKAPNLRNNTVLSELLMWMEIIPPHLRTGDVALSLLARRNNVECFNGWIKAITSRDEELWAK